MADLSRNEEATAAALDRERLGGLSDTPRRGVDHILQPLLRFLFGPELPVRFVFWDGSISGPGNGPGIIQVRSMDAVRRIAWAPGELGVSRAYVAGDIEVEGDTFAVLRALHDAVLQDLRSIGAAMLLSPSRTTTTLGTTSTGCCSDRPWRIRARDSWTKRPLSKKPRKLSMNWCAESSASLRSQGRSSLTLAVDGGPWPFTPRRTMGPTWWVSR